MSTFSIFAISTTARTAAVAVVALVATVSAASAHSKKYDPDKRQAQQATELEAGRRGGSITYFEGLRLRREQNRISQVEADYRSDGKLTKVERDRLKALQNNAEANIRSESNDRWRRWGILPRVGR